MIFAVSCWSVVVSVLSRSVQGLGGPAAAADVQGELCEPRKPAQRVGHHSGQDHRRLLDHGWICKSHQTERKNNISWIKYSQSGSFALAAIMFHQSYRDIYLLICTGNESRLNRLLFLSRFRQSLTVPVTCSRVSFRERTTDSLGCKDSVTLSKRNQRAR